MTQAQVTFLSLSVCSPSCLPVWLFTSLFICLRCLRCVCQSWYRSVCSLMNLNWMNLWFKSVHMWIKLNSSLNSDWWKFSHQFHLKCVCDSSDDTNTSTDTAGENTDFFHFLSLVYVIRHGLIIDQIKSAQTKTQNHQEETQNDSKMSRNQIEPWPKRTCLSNPKPVHRCWSSEMPVTVTQMITQTTVGTTFLMFCVCDSSDDTNNTSTDAAGENTDFLCFSL